MKWFLMRRATHEALLAEEVKRLAEEHHDLLNRKEVEMAAFKQKMADQSAHENQHLRAEVLDLRNQIATLNGKLVHVIDNPEEPLTSPQYTRKV